MLTWKAGSQVEGGYPAHVEGDFRILGQFEAETEAGSTAAETRRLSERAITITTVVQSGIVIGDDVDGGEQARLHLQRDGLVSLALATQVLSASTITPNKEWGVLPATR